MPNDDERREILEAVARGEITPEEAAERLDGGPARRIEIHKIELGGDHDVDDDEPERQSTTVDDDVRAVRVAAAIGTVRVLGDPEVTGVSVEGPHRVRHSDGVLVVESEPLAAVDEDDEHEMVHLGQNVAAAFSFVTGGRRRQVRLRHPRRSVTEVRVNPSLPLTVDVSAGTARVSRIEAPLTLDVSAGSCKVTEHAGSVTGSVAAGSLSVRGRITGEGDLSCEAGALSIVLEPGSDVEVDVDLNMGNLSIKSPDAPNGSSRARHVVVGEGTGRLGVSGNMSSVKIEVLET